MVLRSGRGIWESRVLLCCRDDTSILTCKVVVKVNVGRHGVLRRRLWRGSRRGGVIDKLFFFNIARIDSFDVLAYLFGIAYFSDCIC